MSDERAARYSDLFAEKREHTSECAYCPICATIAVVRNTNPQVLEHFAGAAREMLAAVSIMIAEAEQVVGNLDRDKASPTTGADRSKVRRIDVV
jgi:hypothetical protein